MTNYLRFLTSEILKKSPLAVNYVPKEIFLIELWRKYADAAEEIRVKRYPDYVKLKARLKHNLYTIRVPPDVADQLIKEYKTKKNVVTV